MSLDSRIDSMVLDSMVLDSMVLDSMVLDSMVFRNSTEISFSKLDVCCPTMTRLKFVEA